jgi:hypothetical protein
MQTLYPGIVNSPPTHLTSAVTSGDTTIPVADLSVLPPAPNEAVIGIDVTAETILYEGKSGASGAGNLTTCTRGFQGVATAWDENTEIARNFTEYDYDSIRQNLEELTFGSAIMLGIEIRSDNIDYLLVGSPVAMSAVIESDEAITSYDWDFDDGTTHGTTPSPIHYYAATGDYTVVLVVEDGLGHTRTAQYTLTISSKPSSFVQGAYETVDVIDQSSHSLTTASSNFADIPMSDDVIDFASCAVYGSSGDMQSTNYPILTTNTIISFATHGMTYVNS